MRIKITPADFKTLAPVSATLSRLTSLMRDLNTKTSDIVRVIELDAALTANVLRWANSAFFRSRLKIESLQAAVVRMGMNHIIRLAIGDCLSASLRQPQPGFDLGENGLWRHNMTAALTVEALAQFSEQTLPPVAFTAALLHDIGKFILGRHLEPGWYFRASAPFADEGPESLSAERDLLETDHAEVGAAMANYWKFPAELVHAIENHHRPSGPPDALLDVVMAANWIARMIGGGFAAGAPAGELGAIFRRLDVAAEDLPALFAAVRERMEKTESEWLEPEREPA